MDREALIECIKTELRRQRDQSRFLEWDWLVIEKHTPSLHDVAHIDGRVDLNELADAVWHFFE